MEIAGFEPTMAEDVARCYNDLIEPVPDCYPVAADRFASVAGLASNRLRDEELMAARVGGDIVGFVHVGIALPAEEEDEPKGEPAVIRVLAYRPGQRTVGQALLAWAEQWARQKPRGALSAWNAVYRYRFYHFGFAHLSERIGHVRALFGMNGYEVANSEIYLTWPDYAVPQVRRPELDFELALTWKEGPIGRRLAVSAVSGQERLGVCNVDRGQASEGPNASDWCYCEWLGIAEASRGKRLGAFLLAAALAEMRKAGCRHAAISTNGTNYRAQLLYTNLGYRVTDYTVAFGKEL